MKNNPRIEDQFIKTTPRLICKHCNRRVWWEEVLGGWTLRDALGNICPKDGYWHSAKRIERRAPKQCANCKSKDVLLADPEGNGKLDSLFCENCGSFSDNAYHGAERRVS